MRYLKRRTSITFQRHCYTYPAETCLTFGRGLLKACWLIAAQLRRNSLVVPGHVILENKPCRVRALLTQAICHCSSTRSQPCSKHLKPLQLPHQVFLWKCRCFLRSCTQPVTELAQNRADWWRDNIPGYSFFLFFLRTSIYIKTAQGKVETFL